VPKLLTKLLILLITTSIPLPAHAVGTTPSDIVRGFQTHLIDVMKKADTLDARGRIKKLSGPVDSAFRLQSIGRIAIGSFWNTASDSQRQRFTDAFRAMSLSTLATYFSGYSGERFEISGEQPGPQNTQVVFTHIIKSNKSKTAIDYVMLEFKEGWRIIDVILDKGISELSVRRSEYNLVLREQGLEGLIKLLENKSNELRAQ
jgi:phospholipid transport system substrate-binding protein